ncbi:hypothetical protein [Paraburkholderia sp. J67]|uniref:hypothetical protein n=1 Tax=Paraburkholderia sp. J67 TaxID=2805435 RepID=UPI002ABE95EE|nr:hypothetical protein [Paraburkholderia sp. J67]
MPISAVGGSSGDPTSFYAYWRSGPSAVDTASSGDTPLSSDDASSDLSDNSDSSSADPLAQAVAAALDSLGTGSASDSGDYDDFADLSDSTSNNDATPADKLAALQQFLGSLFQAAGQQSSVTSASYGSDLASAVSGLAQSSSASSSLASNYQNLLLSLGISPADVSVGTSLDLQHFLSTLASNLQTQGASSASGLFIDTSA